jgi:tRNA A-37 threonylcarbamoyl transferase component Bud32
VGGCRLIVADRTTLIWAQRLDADTPAVIKMYRHRGGIDWLRERAFRFRVQREFDALAHIDSRGVSCSKPLFWSYGRSPSFGRYEILATREIEDVLPLGAFIRSSAPDIAELALVAAYRLVRALHRSGCHHGAMYERNILIARRDAQKPAAYIIDMPKAIAFPYDVSGTKMAWIDLFFLTATVLKYWGADGSIAVLRQYGLEDAAARAFVNHTADYRPSKLTRHLFRTECEAWELLARLGVRCGTFRRLR